MLAVILTFLLAHPAFPVQGVVRQVEQPQEPAAHWLDAPIVRLSEQFPKRTYFSYAYHWRMLFGLALVSLSCGAVGSLVVGGRMAFFSDALAHCAFASVSIGFVAFTLIFAGTQVHRDVFWDWITVVMLVFGMGFGFGIAWVRERTGLASDTVIGIFFAFSIGLAAMIRQVMQDRALFTMEDFLFGDPLRTRSEDVVHLFVLAAFTLLVMSGIFNQLLLSSCNPSLALSRQVPIRLLSYLFIILLAVVVNLCVRTVGVLLINALLVVPAASASNVARNVRQMFWLTVLGCMTACLTGPFVCWEVENRLDVRLGIPGTIILICVLLFVVSAATGPAFRARGAKRDAQPETSAAV